MKKESKKVVLRKKANQFCKILSLSFNIIHYLPPFTFGEVQLQKYYFCFK